MTDKTPRAWDGALEQEFYTPEEIAASDARVGEIHREKVMRDLLEACAYFKSSFDAMNGTLACETMYRWAHSIADAVDLLKAQEPITGETSDGYHTFNELYHHRAVLFSVIVANYPDRAWKSQKHHDGTMYDNMFIVGIDTPDGQATYHYDVDPYWDMFKCRVLDNAPEWDGHTPAQAIERIGKLKAREPDEDWISRKRLRDEIQYYIEEAGWGDEVNKVLGWCLEFIDNQEAVKWDG